MATWMGHGLDVDLRIYLRWLSSSRRKKSLQQRRAGGAGLNRIEPLPQWITPDLLEMSLKFKAA
ncbi:MAG: hypothetical protein EBT14_06800 [Betaproteobacteria bacterium]|nr:hypothetical protein [Betaproteobacteria bacterium]